MGDFVHSRYTNTGRTAMPLQFQTAEQVLYFLRGVIYAGESQNQLSPSGVNGFADIMREVIMAREREHVPIGQVLNCLPLDMRPGKPRCTETDLIPLLLLIASEGSRLPEYLRFTLVAESENGGVEPPAQHPRPVAHRIEQLHRMCAWDAISGLSGLPGELNEQIAWLKAITPIPHETWIEGVESLRTAYRQHAKPGEPLFDYLRRILPDWDGSPEVSVTDVLDEHKGIPQLLVRHLIPGFAELLKRSQPLPAGQRTT